MKAMTVTSCHLSNCTSLYGNAESRTPGQSQDLTKTCVIVLGTMLYTHVKHTFTIEGC